MPLLSLDAAEAARPELAPPLLLGSPQGGDWVRVSALADGRSGALGKALDAMASARGYPDPKTIGAGFALITSGAVAGLVYRLALDVPIPVLSPDKTWWRIKPSANVTEVAVDERPEFRPPGRIGEVLHLALGDLYGAIRAQTGFPVRAQWALLASAIGHWLTELVPDDHIRAIALADSIYASDALLSKVRPRVTWLQVEGETRAFTTRRVCCFNYLGRSGAYCNSQCPILPHKERVAHALDDMTRE